LLMALELSAKPDSNVRFLGTITTETPDLNYLRQVLELANLSECLPIISVEEHELYPVYGDTSQTPASVQFLLDQVAKYPGQVSIYSSGSLAAVAMAEGVNPTFASNVKEVRKRVHIREKGSLTRSPIAADDCGKVRSCRLIYCHFSHAIAPQHIWRQSRFRHGQGCGFHR
jgi:hypothetical protein